MFLQKGICPHDETGGAVSALCGSFFGKRFLDGVKLAILRKSLNSEYIGAVGLRSEHAASVDGAAIQHDTTATAIDRATNEFCPLEVMGMQRFQERFTWMYAPGEPASIDLQFYLEFRHDAIPLHGEPALPPGAALAVPQRRSCVAGIRRKRGDR